MAVDAAVNEPQHILVTGGAGHIGSVVTGRLLDLGFRVTVFDKLVYGAEPVLGFMYSPRFRLICGDVRDPMALERAFVGVKSVVHLAAVVGEPACNFDETNAWAINVDGTRAVLTAAKNSGVENLLLASTCSNYGVSSSDALADERAPLHPLGVYARSKVQAETDLLSEDANSLNRTVFRFATICGVSPRMRFDLLVGELARAAVLGEAIQIFAPGAWRPFLHVNDAAQHIAKWVSLKGEEREKVRSKVFNIVGENVQKSDLANLVRKYFPDVKVEVDERTPDKRDYRVSSKLALDSLGWKAETSIEQAFIETAGAISAGVFTDLYSPGYVATPRSKGAFELSQQTQSYNVFERGSF